MKKTFAAVVASIALLAGGAAMAGETQTPGKQQIAETATQTGGWTWTVTYDYPGGSRWHR